MERSDSSFPFALVDIACCPKHHQSKRTVHPKDQDDPPYAAAMSILSWSTSKCRRRLKLNSLLSSICQPQASPATVLDYSCLWLLRSFDALPSQPTFEDCPPSRSGSAEIVCKHGCPK